jgi:hypothetical protein
MAATQLTSRCVGAFEKNAAPYLEAFLTKTQNRSYTVKCHYSPKSSEKFRYEMDFYEGNKHKNLDLTSHQTMKLAQNKTGPQEFKETIEIIFKTVLSQHIRHPEHPLTLEIQFSKPIKNILANLIMKEDQNISMIYSKMPFERGLYALLHSLEDELKHSFSKY